MNVSLPDRLEFTPRCLHTYPYAKTMMAFSNVHPTCMIRHLNTTTSPTPSPFLIFAILPIQRLLLFHAIPPHTLRRCGGCPTRTPSFSARDTVTVGRRRWILSLGPQHWRDQPRITRTPQERARGPKQSE